MSQNSRTFARQITDEDMDNFVLTGRLIATGPYVDADEKSEQKKAA